ncbi:unnamed protein product, partial [Mesorhabditis belari]|uniref:Translocon-associated protein subunit gamma n=1 Tax=Mesorhabditis belari TaxID=2138241 RepID=A0AAF3EZ04_9BILA
MSKATTKFSKEEEILLNSFSADVSAQGSALFLVNSFVTAVAPVYLFYGVHQLEVSDGWIVWTVAVLAATYLLTWASKNQKHQLKHKLVQKRTQAVEREINKKYADDKKISRKEKEERALFRRNEVADSESTWLSIFFNNVLFISLLLVLSFFFFANFNPLFNSFFSIVGAAGVVAFISTSKN